jgi:hypothetical protein
MIKQVVIVVALLISAAASSNPVRSLGVGASADAAKHHAFQRAIEKKLGTLIVSDLNIQQQKIITDEILNYSAGYVTDFNIISAKQANGRYLIEADVWVKESKIRDRILYRNNSKTTINGELLNEKVASYLDAKASGDKLLQKVIQSYPHRSFDVDLKSSNFKFDEYRRLHFTADVLVKWNNNFINALTETLSALEDSNKQHSVTTVTLTNNTNNFFKRTELTTFHFNDIFTLRKISSVLEKHSPILVISFNQHGKFIYSKCIELSSNNYFIRPSGDNLHIKSTYNESIPVSLPLHNIDVKSVTDVKITIIGKDQC